MPVMFATTLRVAGAAIDVSVTHDPHDGCYSADAPKRRRWKTTGGRCSGPAEEVELCCDGTFGRLAEVRGDVVGSSTLASSADRGGVAGFSFTKQDYEVHNT